MEAEDATTFTDDDGWNVSSSDEIGEEEKALLNSEGHEDDEPEDEDEKASKAASELGKRGGKASAEKRKAKDDEPEHEKPKDDEEKPLGKPRDDPRARMLQATQREAALKRELEAREAREKALEERLASLETLAQRVQGGSPQRQQRAPQGQFDDDPEPKEEDFDNYSDGLMARIDWRLRQRERAQQERMVEQQRAVQDLKQADSVIQTISKKVSEIEDPGVKERVVNSELMGMLDYPSSIPGVKLTADSVLADLIVNSPHMAGLILHFEDNPGDFEEARNSRDIVELTRKVAWIEGRLGNGNGNGRPRRSAVPTVSRAKPPARPFAGSTNVSNEYSDDDDLDTFIEQENAKEARRR